MFSHNMLYAHEITLVNACTEYGRDDFFSYLTDFSYFSVNFFFSKIAEHSQNRSKNDLFESGCRWFQLFQ